MSGEATKVTASEFDAGPAPLLTPLAPSDDPLGFRWRWVELQLDEEPFYEFGEVR